VTSRSWCQEEAPCYKGRVRIARATVTAIVAVVGLATVVGLLDRLSWVFEAADVFRLQYLVVLLAAGLIAGLLRKPRLAAIAAGLAVLNVVVIGIPLSGEANATVRASGGTVRLVVANVEVGNTDYEAVERLVARTEPDVFGVVELTPAMAGRLADALPGYRTHIVATENSAYGIGVFSRVPLHHARVVRSAGTPTVVADVRVGGRLVTLVVAHVHTPFAGPLRDRQLRALTTTVRGLGSRTAVCGDFNAPPWSGRMQEFASSADLRDTYRASAWSGYSWPTWNVLLRVPLDNCYVTRDVDVVEHHEGPGVGSDHRPLVVDLAAVA
jgi:endonuclease/exonuclease/phosphatase (EEP) superfamily protein YafD